MRMYEDLARLMVYNNGVVVITHGEILILPGAPSELIQGVLEIALAIFY